MINGIYALASLDGSPIGERDRAALSLPPGAGDCAASGHDGDAAAIDTTPDAVFAGYLDEHGALAAALGMDRRTSRCALAVAALDRYGDATATHMPGEWSLLRWDAPSRTLTLCAADTCRDPLYFAVAGGKVAVAPDIHRLAAIDWIGARIDPRGLLLSMARAPMRGTLAGETILRGVVQVQPGSCVRISARGTQVGAVRPFVVGTELWPGSFADAIAELDALLLDIIRQQVARTSSIAVLQSGGLDSSLLAVYVARARTADQDVLHLTSAAPPGSGLKDETDFARMVADHLGAPMIPIVPDADGSFYRPSERRLATMQSPAASPRHYLYDALEQAAVDRGAASLFDGAFGELTITGYRSLGPQSTTLRNRLGKAARAALAMRPRWRVPQDAFHVRLSRDTLALVRGAFDREWRLASSTMPDRPLGTPCGMVPGAEKCWLQPTATIDPALRYVMPFRDRRLMALFARMPTDFLTYDGIDRAPGRALLSGHVPDAIRDRPKGAAFSPDYFIRVKREAPMARERMAVLAAAGADDWIDFKWLDRSLASIVAGDHSETRDIFLVQATTIAAEFLYRLAKGAIHE